MELWKFLSVNNLYEPVFKLLSIHNQICASLVQLEKIRASDTQVRWQHEDDVDVCPTCRQGFTSSKKKQHCLHCGQIFCPQCLGHAVKSGPKQRSVRVCDVCHTLLVKSSAPYFSTEPPHTSD